jgi:hypothetical protein
LTSSLKDISSSRCRCTVLSDYQKGKSVSRKNRQKKRRRERYLENKDEILKLREELARKELENAEKADHEEADHKQACLAVAE